MIEYNLDIMDIEWEFGNKYESNRANGEYRLWAYTKLAEEEEEE